MAMWDNVPLNLEGGGIIPLFIPESEMFSPSL